MNKVDFFKYTSLGLLLTNTLLLAILFFRPGGGPPPHPRPEDWVVNQLNLDEAQRQEFRSLVRVHREALKEKQQDLMDAKERLYQSLRKGAEPQETEDLLERVDRTQGSIERLHFSHFQAVKNLCRPEQLEAFSALTKELSHFFRRPKRPE